MKIDKAIEILREWQEDHLTRMTPDFDDALKLGVEALKSIQLLRNRLDASYVNLLPGETPEEET